MKRFKWDKEMPGLGVIWTRPDIVCSHHLVTAHLGPLCVFLYDGHERDRPHNLHPSVAEKGVPPSEIQFR